MDDPQRDPGGEDLHPDAPDTFALRRRVLLTGLLALVLYVASVVLLDTLRVSSLYAFLAAALIYVLVVRPMMAPVRDAVRLRRRLAFQAWAERRDDDGPAGGGSR